MQRNNPIRRRLYRSRTNSVIFGVCGGLGEYFNVDPMIFRLIFIVFTLGAGSGVLIYFIMAFLIPKIPLSEIGDPESESIDIKSRIETLVLELRELHNLYKRRNMFGLIIVLFGVFLLLNQLLPWQIFDWGVLWAILIIYLGILVLKGGYNFNEHHDSAHNPNLDNVSATKEKITTPKNHYPNRHGGGLFHLFFGLVFLLIGFGFLVQNFNLVPGLNFNFSILLSFWPVLIILAGLSVLSRGTWIGYSLSVLITLTIIIVLAFYFMLPGNINVSETFSFDIPKTAKIKHANIFIEVGASSVEMRSGGDSLISGSLNSNVATLTAEDTVKDGIQFVKIKMQENFEGMKGRLANNLNFNIAEDVPLSVQMESGASDIVFDASNLILEDLELNTGASKIVLVLGNKAEDAYMLLKAGVSSIDITIPENVGTKIQVNGSLSQNNFAGFDKISENFYQTSNYDSSDSKLNIVIEAGISSISITRVP